MELADLVVINKADLDTDAATRAEAQITSALRLTGLHGHGGAHSHAGAPDAVPVQWQPRVMQLSALLGQGLAAFWSAVSDYRALQSSSGASAVRRRQQAVAWMWERIDAGLKQEFRQHPAVRELLPKLTGDVVSGRLPASTAARSLLLARATQQ